MAFVFGDLRLYTKHCFYKKTPIAFTSGSATSFIISGKKPESAAQKHDAANEVFVIYTQTTH